MITERCPRCGRRFPAKAVKPIRCVCHLVKSPDINSKPDHSDPSKQPHGGEKAELQKRHIEEAHAAWSALHTYTQDGEWNEDQCRLWYSRTWKKMIPQYGCACGKEFAEIEINNMPAFHSEEAFANWGFDIHNVVNKKLGKPQYPREKAWEDRLQNLEKISKLQ